MTSFEESHPGLVGKMILYGPGADGKGIAGTLYAHDNHAEGYAHARDIHNTQIDKQKVLAVLERLEAKAHNISHVEWREIREAIEELGL